MGTIGLKTPLEKRYIDSTSLCNIIAIFHDIYTIVSEQLSCATFYTDTKVLRKRNVHITPLKYKLIRSKIILSYKILL